MNWNSNSNSNTNASSPKASSPIFNRYGVRHRNLELNTAFSRYHKKQINKELNALRKMHLVKKTRRSKNRRSRTRKN